MTQRSFDGQTALITGGTGGIGRETALLLAAQGAQVIIAGRSAEKGAAVVAEIERIAPDSGAAFHTADLSLMRGVDALADMICSAYPRLDMLVHCAGVMLPKRTLTAEGLETVFAVQCLARLRLTERLLEPLRAAPSPRVVSVSAGGTIDLEFDFDNLQGEKRYDGVHALQHESVANDLLTLEQAARFPGVRFYNYGPGYVRTPLLRDMPGLFRGFAGFVGLFIGYTPGQAAMDIVRLLADAPESGLYGRKGKHNAPSTFKADRANQTRLYETGERLIAGALTS